MKPKDKITKLAESIQKRLMADLTDRRGFRQEYDLVDKDTKDEWRETWNAIIVKELKKG
jgi:hypothetical protein